MMFTSRVSFILPLLTPFFLSHAAQKCMHLDGTDSIEKMNPCGCSSLGGINSSLTQAIFLQIHFLQNNCKVIQFFLDRWRGNRSSNKLYISGIRSEKRGKV